jgi:hypothetical protein
MSRSVYFVQECPTCGRTLHIRVEYLGRNVVCQHCHARFDACDQASAPAATSPSGLDLLRRAEELLQTVKQQTVSKKAVISPTVIDQALSQQTAEPVHRDGHTV